MRSVLLLLITLLYAQTTPQVPNPLNNGAVEGNVIWASQTRPLEGIPVYLRRDGENAQDAQRRGVVVTDTTGHFLLKDIPPGEYVVVTDRRGYFREIETEIRITVTPRATVKDIAIRMIVGGNIIGRTLDINGVPLAGVGVSATQPFYLAPSGKRDFQQQGQGGSDDRGEYRVRGLRPGVYYVRADIGFWASDSMVYYPGVKDSASAVPITVREAQDTTVNFRVEAKLKPIMTISGRVVSPFTGVPAKPIDRILISSRESGSTYYDNRADDRSEGRFEIRNIFPDNYDLYPDARDADGRFYTSRTNVDVIDRSIENLTLSAVVPVDVRGRLMLNGEPLAGRIDNVGINLQPVRGLDLFLVNMNMNGNVPNIAGGITVDRQTGEFTIPRVAPGVYKVAPARLPPAGDIYVEDVIQGITSVYKDGFEVTDKPPEPIQLLLTSPGARVEGVVRNLRQEPAVRARIVLVPDASRRQDPTRYREAFTDKDGKFAFRGIPPGTYKAFAWESVPQSAWFNSDFIQKYDSRGQSITLDRGANVALQLTFIPREPDPQ
jgi:protocatechuate 3,4-dioxygenase beta subunit